MELICGNQKILVENVVRQYSTMLYRLSMLRLKNKEDAEEVVQDTFLKLIYQIKKGITFENEEHLKAWLLKVAVNRGKSIATLAWNKKTEGLDRIQEPKLQEKDDFHTYAYDYVLKLPEKYRIAIDLFYFEQFTTEQIAKIMTTKQSTVRSYLHRGREKLKRMMEADGYVG